MLHPVRVRAARLALPALGFCLLAFVAGCGGTVGTPVSPGAPITPTPTASYSYSPASLDFGTVPTGTTSAGQTVTVTSNGTSPVIFTGGGTTGDYLVSAGTCPTTPTTVPVGQTCTITLEFAPMLPGTRTGTLTLSGNTATTPVLNLTGIGGLTSDSVSTSALNFGSVALGTSSAAQTVAVTATGTTPLAFSSLTLTGDFARPSTTCTALLSPGTSCQIDIIFTPGATGARTGTLTIGSNATGSPQTIALSGTGVTPPTVVGMPFSVKVAAGSAPVAGASVQLYAAGSAGVRTGSAPLLAQALLTDATGSVSVSGYTCPAAGTQVYLLASGGTVGSATSANANSLLMTAVGPCGGIAGGTTLVVNEATSVAAVYALQQFYAPGGVVGASVSNATGLANAFGTASQLIDPTTGAPGTLPATTNSPAARVYSVANMVNACLARSAQCGALYAATTVNGTAPTNTLDAVYNLARFPAANVAALYAQSTLTNAYPGLPAVPSDWTMFFTYSGGGMNSPSGIAVDSTGSVWVSNYFYVASKFTPQGVPVFSNGLYGVGLNNSYGLAIDLSDNAWIPNEQPYTNYGIGSVTVLTPAGGYTSGGGGFQQGGLNYPLSVAIDPNGTTWVVDYGNSHLTLLNSFGTPLSGQTGYTTPLFAFPVAVALDANHFGWIANQSSNTITKVAPDGSSFVNYSCCQGASGLALDQGNNVWVANFYGDSVSLISNSGAVIGNASYTGNGGLSRPQGIALDGAGNVWVANYRQTYLTELAGTGSTTVGASLTPKTGYGADAKLLEAYALAIDPSGNLWVSNQGSNTITKFVGLAAPVRTPLSALPKAP